MQGFRFKRPSRAHQFAIAACTLATLLTDPTALASTPAPTITGTPATSVAAGKNYSFTPKATAPKGTQLTFSVAGKPGWAGFNKVSGQLVGTPTSADVGKYSNIVIRVSDGAASASLQPFAITVTGHKAPLSISGTPAASIPAGKHYSFLPKVVAPTGAKYSFAISHKPAWATFTRTTGLLAGTPTNADAGRYPNIAISVTYLGARAVTKPFAITVTAASANSPPTITGTPRTTATVGTAYSFTPSAQDPNGDAISFSVKNKPVWASFSIAKGTISGTPTAANVGTFSGIVISASDGHASASLPAFSITVSKAATGGTGTGSAVLHWTAPTRNTNGSALTDLAGYHVYYGKSPSSMTTTATIANPGTTSYTISNLASGTWYFAVTAYTTDGLESARSNTGSKTIP